MKGKGKKQFFKKSYQKRGPNKKDKKSKPQFKNKYKHIARNQQSEEYLKRVRAADDKRKLANVPQSESDNSEVDEPDPFNQLLESLTNSKGTSNAIESDLEESEEEEMGEEEEEETRPAIDDVIDDILNSDESESDQEDSEPETQEVAVEPEEEAEEPAEDDEAEAQDKSSRTDPFSAHFDHDLSPELFEAVSTKSFQKRPETWPHLKQLLFELPQARAQDQSKPRGLLELGDAQVFATPGGIPKVVKETRELPLKNQLFAHIGDLDAFERELASVVSQYQDLYFCQRSLDNAESIRKVYCLHALNHALKTRARVLHHNARLNRGNAPDILPDYFRDQGLTRPKVLIVCPFRDSAFRVVNLLTQFFCAGDKSKVMNHARFIQEFTGEELFLPKRNPKPEDYERTFTGNVDDNFRLGMALTKKNLKLYTDFYASDIIVASPLGLRMTIGAKGEEQDFDFLSSIELLVLDQAELFYAQNWEHVLHLFEHMHLKPSEMRGADFSRVRSWILAGQTKLYCQTLLFASHELPEFRSVFNQRMLNYAGRVRQLPQTDSGSIRHVMVQTPQIFQRVDVTSLEQSFEERFRFFVQTVLPQYQQPSKAHCLVYVPSYFDYIRLRNHFKREDVSFVQVSEYSKDEKVARARDMFFHSSAHFLLYSERAHFFKRARVKGIRNIVFYAPPAFPQFYPEMLNLMQDTYQNPRDGCENSKSVTVIYTKYDLLQVAAIIGTERAAKISAPTSKKVHMFMTNGIE